MLPTDARTSANTHACLQRWRLRSSRGMRGLKAAKNEEEHHWMSSIRPLLLSRVRPAEGMRLLCSRTSELGDT